MTGTNRINLVDAIRASLEAGEIDIATLHAPCPGCDGITHTWRATPRPGVYEQNTYRHANPDCPTWQAEHARMMAGLAKARREAGLEEQ